jgi:hypothetical protein
VRSYQQERWAGDKAMDALHAMLLQLAADNVMNDFDEIFKHHTCLICACG